jgi:type IV secretory pathway VirB10-like protein
MSGNQNPPPEALVTGPSRIPGIVQVRQSVVLAITLIVTILVGLMLWLIASRAGNITPPPPEQLSAGADAANLHPSNVLTLHQNDNSSNALPKASPVPQQTIDPNLLAAPPQPNLAAASNVVPAAAVQPMSQEQETETPTERRFHERSEARARAIAETQAARESDLRVHLDSSDAAIESTRLNGNRNTAAPSNDPDAYDLPPASEYVLQRGMIIPATLYTSIDSTLTGTITGLVAADVYDSRHRTVLIPRGAKLTGTYQSNVSQGQARLFVAWDAIKLPNDHTIPLGSMPGVDLAGSTGFGASVDRHTAQLFRSVVLLSILSAGAQLSQPQNSGNCGSYGCQSSVGQQMAASVGQNITQAGTQIVSRDANIMPTLHVSEGSQVAVMVENDIPLHPWSAAP